MPGRKRQTPRFVGRARVMERGVGMGVQRVATPRQILGLTVARMVNFRLNAAWPAPRRSAPVRRSGPGRAPRRLRTGDILARACWFRVSARAKPPPGTENPGTAARVCRSGWPRGAIV